MSICLTPEREADLFMANMKNIERIVDNYISRCACNYTCADRDDFVQEVSIAYLAYLRRCDSEEALTQFPWFDAMNAMRNCTLATQPLSVGRSPHLFSDIIHNMPSTVSYDVNPAQIMEFDGLSKRWVDAADLKMDFDTLMASQSAYLNRIVGMIMWGMSQKQIASQFGVSPTAIRKQITKLREAYEEFFNKEDEEDE